MSKNKYGILFGVLFAGSALAAQACGTSDNTGPSEDDDIVNRPQGGAPGNDGTGATGNTGNLGGGSNETPFEPPPDRQACPVEPDGVQPGGANVGEPCWNIANCNATEEQFLEQCSGTALEVFDNSRIENFDGTLP